MIIFSIIHTRLQSDGHKIHFDFYSNPFSLFLSLHIVRITWQVLLLLIQIVKHLRSPRSPLLYLFILFRLLCQFKKKNHRSPFSLKTSAHFIPSDSLSQLFTRHSFLTLSIKWFFASYFTCVHPGHLFSFN